MRTTKALVGRPCFILLYVAAFFQTRVLALFKARTMTHPRGLANLGLELNSAHLGEWPRKIGQYILNFGAIELMSYQYLLRLEVTRFAFNKNLDLLLSPRIDRILQLVKESKSIANEDKAEIEALWLEARELSRWRNRIAHNPVLPTWKPGSDPNRDPPDLMGVPDMRQLKSSDASDSISLLGMDMLIDASSDLGKQIHAASAKLPKARACDDLL